MLQNKEQEFCRIELSTLFEKAYQCQVKVVGTIQQIFQHKRYIVQVYLNNKVVLRSLKRYSEFEALDEVIRMNFKNIDLSLGQFPSKFQVFNREEDRRSYFQKMLTRIIHIYCETITNQTNRRLLSTCFVFLAGEHLKNKNYKKSTEAAQSEVRSLEYSFSDSLKKEQVIEELSKLQNQKQVNLIKKGLRKKSIQDYSMKKYVDQEYVGLGDEFKFRMFIGTEFLVRFEDEKEWKERYLKIQNSCLLIYKHKNENNFKTKIELYQAKIEYMHRDKNIFDHFCEKMEINNDPTFHPDTSTIAVSHQYDYKKLLIKIKPDEKLTIGTAMELLTKASHQSTISEAIEGVFSPIGKLFIVLHKITFEEQGKKTSPIVYLRIKCSGLQYETKRMTYTDSMVLNIKQGFMIPISNSFACIHIQVIVIENEGIIRHQSEEKIVSRYRIYFSDFISYPQGYGFERIQAKTEINPEVNCNHDSTIQLSIMNYSHFSSIYGDSYANENDGILMSGLKSTSDTDELVTTVDRVLRGIGHIALFIQAFWRNVYLFKYPRLGYTFFSTLMILFLIGSAGTIFQIIMMAILTAMVYNYPPCHKFIQSLSQEYIFKHIHESFKYPKTLSKNQLGFLKWTSHLRMIKQDYDINLNGKLQKNQLAKDKKYRYWTFKIHGKQFKIKEELPGIIEKVFEVKKIVELVLRMISAAINTIEKICNVFSWADPRRSFVLFSLLFFICNVVNVNLLRMIGFLFCTHRLVKGLNFYKIKHYKNNRKLAVYCLRYVINKQFRSILPKQESISTTDQKEIEQILQETYFMIRDEEKLKKLRLQIQEILGVYIDPDELFLCQDKKTKSIKMIDLVQMIQSCESRLKLQWISGQQGVKDDFQELKRLTKQYPVIDLWVESLLINFVLNVPSQLYTTFRPVRPQQSLIGHKPQNSSNLLN